ncbi:xanthine dehydrogenase family protein molybdopterin-binding subunit [Capillimicrobium parvum]|uniref:Carbon monoxide dehydrogenase large chain n=1 Tax=Capillimicrobium parvum TaxID=2884022 RepID=A0A9E6Y2V1_9ACTN|nr:xanthine dehydrogenase family protein molybdopterin-binding subunit [Capillimicrobium parvum]UGS38989.1 Carbon monoxide dehydrogenase large chain [Capillimicrobium parvum]
MAQTEIPKPEAPRDLQWIGKSIKRVEDPKYLRGVGKYVDDLDFDGMLHAAVLRSPYPHARIVSIDMDAARALPGVHAVISGAEAAEMVDPMPDSGPNPDKHVFRVLAVDKVRYVGEGVAIVVADTRYIAEDARDLIDVEYEPMEPIVDPIAAAEDTTNLVHDELGTNIAYERTFTFGEVEQDFADADIIIKDRLHWRRCAAQPLDCAGAIADYDPGTGEMTIHSNSVSMTWFAFGLAATLRVPSNKLNVIPIPSGGSFGSRFGNWRAHTTAGLSSKVTGRPVKFVEDRLDHITNGDHHSSDRYYDVELALMKDGTFRSLKTDVIDDYGAYLYLGVGTHGNAMAQVTGPYTIRSTEYRLRAVLTNKTQQGAYRGFGAEVANWVIERAVDKAAAELGMDPAEIRRRNFIQPDQFPYYIPTGNMYDSGNYERVLDHALELFDYDAWRAEQEKMRADGRKVGIGLVSCQERSVYSATEFWFWFDEPAAETTSTPEGVTITVDPLGNLTVTLYSVPFWGNSSDTMASMLAGEEFGVDPSTISIEHHGTKGGLPAAGPGGSRLTVMYAGAIKGAAEKIKDKARLIAAQQLEASPEDLEWVDSGFQVKGSPDVRKGLPEIAMAAYLFATELPEGLQSGLEARHVYDHPFTTMPSKDRTDLGVFYPCMGHACHIAMVEVDVETGGVKILRYVAVHDAGTMVNPRSLEGQIIGGTAQGVATALLEEVVYDAEGQPLSTAFTDFLMPSAMEAPEVIIGHEETPSPLTEYGIKGGGEAGRMMAPGAMSAAIDDALTEFGVHVSELPATPERITRWIGEPAPR